MRITRRKFIKSAAFAGLGVAAAAGTILSAPSILTRPRVPAPTGRGELVFRPYFVQEGRGPHLLDWAYATDERWDTFHSNITAGADGVKISDTEGIRKFGIDVRWNVEGFGYIYMTANNGGEFYELPGGGDNAELNLNYELAKSRVIRNRTRRNAHEKTGWKPGRDVRTYLDLSDELLADAAKTKAGEQKRAELSQKALYYALWGAEMMELDKANDAIAKRGHRKDFFFGCDGRAYFQMFEPRFLECFTELFNFVNITYVIKGDNFLMEFEPKEGDYQFDNRDTAIKAMRERNVTIGCRPLFWFHKWVTPDWVKEKSFDQLKKYVEKHTRDVISHYPEGVYSWEIMNEFHDWANEVNVSPEQAVELTKLACDVARDTNPKIHRLINNCCPFAEYVQMKQSSNGKPASYRQRTPWQFTKDLVDAGVDFTLTGQQMYFPYRDLQDIVITLERLEDFKKPIQITEVGCPGGPTNDTVKTGKWKFPADPYAWRRPWDEELHADWMEGVYTLAYSKPSIEACNWFDFVDPYSYIENGGLYRAPKGDEQATAKAAVSRMKNMQERWKKLT